MFALSLIASVLLAFVLLGRIPSEAQWAADLANFAHGPVFATLTLIVVAMLRRHSTRGVSAGLEYALALALVLLLGLSIEAVQSMIGRDAEVSDLLRDALGALVALGFLATTDPKMRAALPRRRWRIFAMLIGITGTTLLLAPLVIAMMAYLERQRIFPVLADFDRPFSTYFVSDLAGVTSQRELLPHMSAGQAGTPHALLVMSQTPTWWGIALREPSTSATADSNSRQEW
jgi:VanZ family protein